MFYPVCTIIGGIWSVLQKCLCLFKPYLVPVYLSSYQLIGENPLGKPVLWECMLWGLCWLVWPQLGYGKNQVTLLDYSKLFLLRYVYEPCFTTKDFRTKLTVSARQSTTQFLHYKLVELVLAYWMVFEEGKDCVFL